MRSEPIARGDHLEVARATEPSTSVERAVATFFSSMAVRLFFLMLVVLLPLVSYSGWEISHRMEVRRGQAADQLADIAVLISAELRSRIDAGRQVLASLSVMEEVRGGDLDACGAAMARVVHLHDHVSAFAKIDSDYMMICNSAYMPEPIDLGWTEAVPAAFASEAFTVGPLVTGATTFQPIITLYYPIWDENGAMTGIVGFGLKMTWLTDWLTTLTLPSRAEARIFAGDGTILAQRPGGTNAIGQPLQNQSFLEAVLERQSATGIVEAEASDPLLAGFAELPDVLGGMYIVVSQPKSIAMADLTHEVTRRAVLLGFVIALGSLLAWAGAHLLVNRRIDQLAEAASRLERGEFGARAISSPDRTEFGRLASVYNRMVDAVEQRERMARLDLIRAKEAAERASTSKSQFLAQMSHELRTPLNGIIGLSEIMRMRLFGPINHDRYEGYVHDIHGSANHLLRTINMVLDLSKIEAGRYELVLEPVVLEGLVRESLTVVAPLAEDKGLTVSFQPPAMAVSLTADPDALRRALLNVVGNAVKFTKQGGSIDIVMQRDGSNSVRLSITDTGIGISKNKINVVFEPFEQACSSPTIAREGTGLGLPIARHLVELHGGRLTIESEVDKGTCVSIVLPVAAWHTG